MVVLPVGLLSLIALLWSAPLIAGSVFGKPELAPLIRALGLGVPFMSLRTVLLAATRAVKVIKYTVVSLAAQAVSALVLAIPLLALGVGSQAIAFSYVASHVLGAGLALYFYLQAIPIKERSFEKHSLRQMVKFSLPLSLNNWMHFANERTEVFFLGLLPGAVDVGIYNMAWRVAGLELVFVESLNQILAPFASDLSHRQAHGQLETLYKATAKWSFTGAFMLFLIFALFSERIMNVFDPAFVAGSGVLVAVGFAQLINTATGPCGTVLVMSGRSDLSLLNTIALFAISITLDWLLIPSYGLVGAAVAGTLAIVSINLLRIAEVWLTLRIHPFKWSFAKPVVAGLSSLTIVVGLRTFVHSGTVALDLAYSLLLVVTYVVIIYLLKLDAEDTLVINALRRRILGPQRA